MTPPTKRTRKATPTEKPSEPQQRVPAPVHSVPPIVLLERSYPLRLVIQTMRNGALSNAPGGRPFVPHQGLMLKLRAAYDAGDTDAYLAVVQDYLEQALRVLPHAGHAQEIPGKIAAIRTLIDEIGLPMVGQRMLAVIHAPV